MANDEGKKFEQDWQNSYKGTGYYFLRLVDSNKFNFGEGTRFTMKNPFDNIHYSVPFLFPLELKSTKGSSMSFDREKKDKKMIKYHQIKGLTHASNHEGVIGGFILNFRPRKVKGELTDSRVFFVHIRDFNQFVKTTDKKSINVEDCEKIGIEVTGNKKITRYTYDIEEFVNKAVTYCLANNYIDREHLSEIKEWIERVL